jgi:tetratricopeptide (TPR) repeat protein/predicted Ser/Thr protein kinase
MLFRRDILQGIAEGRVTLAFRRWRRSPPADGSSLRSPVEALGSSVASMFLRGVHVPLCPEFLCGSGFRSVPSLYRISAFTMPLAPGMRLGSYEIVSPLGSGGMGVVYLAKDLRLEREVAIKVISPDVADDPERLRRFVREARMASALNHPNIAHVYEIGESDGVHFIAMEYVRGRSLADRIGGRPMPVADVIVYATQIADALDEAHAHDVIHRDLKPANAIISTRGRLKILDFGLAKIESDSATAGGAPTATTDTAVGLVMGTLDYMSPEQVRGLPLDRRTDIFSFGSLLYEMLTGRRPFASNSRTDTVYRITQAQVDPVNRYAYDVPVDLERIARKCLEKDPARRYQSARDLLVDLSGLRRDSSSSIPVATVHRRGWQIGHRQRLALTVGVVGAVVLAAAVGAFLWLRTDVVESLAVIPAQVRSADPRDGDLARGFASSLNNRLKLLSNLKLLPTQIAFAAGGTDADPVAGARQLNVHAAVVVQVEERGDSAVLQVEMFDLLHQNELLWSYRETKKLAEVELVSERLATEIAEQINLRLNPEDANRREVYRLYQEGRVNANRRTESGVRQAIELFQQATLLDDTYAPAWAGLANGYNIMQTYAWMRAEEAFPKVRGAANKALGINPNLAEAHTQLAWTLFRWDWDWAGAEQAFLKAIALGDPNAQAHHWLSVLLSAVGRFDDALVRVAEAQKIDPLSEAIAAEPGWTLYMARRYRESIEASNAARKKHPTSNIPYRFLGLAQQQAGLVNEAIDSFSTAIKLAGGSSSVLAAELGHAYGIAGRHVEAKQILADLYAQRAKSYVSPFSLAIVNAGLKDVDATLEWLDVALREKANLLVWAKVDPRMDLVRSHPRFVKLLEEMGFPD